MAVCWYHDAVKSPRAVLAGLVLVLVAAAAAGCGGVADPEGWSPPHFEDSTVYLFLDKDRLSSVTLGGDGGTVAWSFPDDDLSAEEDIKIVSSYGEVIVDGDVVYFGGYEGQVYAVSRETGRLRWTTEGAASIDGGIVDGPILVDGKLFFGTTEGKVYALSAADGRVADGWPASGVDVGRGVWASPVVSGTTLFVATMGGKVYALSIADGTPVWAAPFESGRGAIPALSLAGESTLFVPTLGRRVYLVDTQSGQAIGEPLVTADWVWTDPVVADGVAYFGDFGGHLHALDITTGREVWARAVTVDEKVKAGPAVVDGMLVFADHGPTVYFVALEDGEVLNSVPLPTDGTVRARVVAEGGFAYIVTTKGKLFRANPANRSVVEVPIGGAN